MSERSPISVTWDWMSPSAERLLSKITNLEELQKKFEARTLTLEQERVVEVCKDYLVKARGFLDRPAISLKSPFFSRKHPHLVWELLHRVDEYQILLLNKDELVNKALEVRTAFDLNIKEEKTRNDWIGPKGRFVAVLERIEKQDSNASDRDAVKKALQIVNEQVDRTFWQLSANTLTSVWSALILGLLMWAIWRHHAEWRLASLGTDGLEGHYATLLVLGLMGAYVSNLLTKENFLYVRGAPFFRYWLYNVMAKPLIGAFAAVFIYVVEKSKLLFSISAVASSGDNAAAAQLITLHVQTQSVPYVYAVLAISSGFAADKLLRSTFDGVLKRLEQKAEKTKDATATA